MNRLKAAWNALRGKLYSPFFGGMNGVSVDQGRVVWIDDNLGKYVGEGYSANDIVYSICHITSEKIKVAPWNVYKIKDESSLKMMQAEFKQGITHKNYKKVLDLRTKALELYGGDGKLNELLKWPNEEDSFPDLVANSSTNKMLTGNRYVEARMLDAGANQGKPQELYLDLSQCMSIKATSGHPSRVTGYEYYHNGAPIPLTKEAVMHDKYYNPLGSLYGMAPLKAASRTLTNENSSLSASTWSYQNMGPGQMVFNKDQRLSGPDAATQMKLIKERWYNEDTGTRASKKTVFTPYELGVAQMGLSPVDLAIIEQQKWNLVRFCNVWNFPHLMLLSDHMTDNNAGWAEKALTSRCALPLMTSFRDNFNRKLATDWGYAGKNIYIDYDLSVYNELQQNMTELTAWIEKSWWLPLKMRYELMQLEVPDYINEQDLEKIFVPSGLTELSEMGMMDEDVRAALAEQAMTAVRQNGNGKPKPVMQ